MHKLANPNRFLRIITWLRLPITIAMAICLGAGLYIGLFDSPADYQQGETVRIMYIHVPAAWMAVMGYGAMALSSAAYIIWKHPVADYSARAMAPIGAVFCVICLVTGALWGKPMWGTWWVWDARLTSVLILLFIYIGYIALVNADPYNERTGKAAAVLAMVGAINLPIIKFSVEWFNTLHQPASILRRGGPSIAPEMLTPLVLMIVGAALLFALIWSWGVERQILQRKIQRLQWQLLSAKSREANNASAHEEYI